MADCFGQDSRKIYKIVGHTGADFLPVTHFTSFHVKQSVMITLLPLLTVSAGLQELLRHMQVVTRNIVNRTFQNMIVTNE